MANFEAALDFVLKVEGGYCQNVNDRGGATKYGITIGTLQAWRGDDKLTALDVERLTKEEASEIYRAWYWDQMKLDQVKDLSLATTLFDQGVNRGVVTAVTQMQTVLNDLFKSKLEPDGRMGPRTLEALNSVDPDTVLMEYVFLSQDAYASLASRKPSQLGFLRGWINRTQELLKLVARRPKT